MEEGRDGGERVGDVEINDVSGESAGRSVENRLGSRSSCEKDSGVFMHINLPCFRRPMTHHLDLIVWESDFC